MMPHVITWCEDTQQWECVTCGYTTTIDRRAEIHYWDGG